MPTVMVCNSSSFVIEIVKFLLSFFKGETLQALGTRRSALCHLSVPCAASPHQRRNGGEKQ